MLFKSFNLLNFVSKSEDTKNLAIFMVFFITERTQLNAVHEMLSLKKLTTECCSDFLAREPLARILWNLARKYCRKEVSEFEENIVKLIFNRGNSKLSCCPSTKDTKYYKYLCKIKTIIISLNPFTPRSDLPNRYYSSARPFYLSKWDSLGVKGLKQH